MKSSGRWSLAGDEGDTLGAETFDQTMDVELSRYLSKAGGIGLSQRLLGAFDALVRIADEAPAAASSSASSKLSALSSATGSSSSATGTSNGVNALAGLGTTRIAGRTGWNSMRLDAPAYGGSGAEWAGFNNDRALSGGDDSSVKDAFFRWTYGSSFNPAGKSKEEIAGWLRDNVQSARDYGLNVLDVKGEQILIETEERGAEWVDVVSRAGAADAKWQWLTQTEFGTVGGGAIGDALANLRASSDGEARVRALMSSTTMTGEGLLASIRAEVTAAASGGTFIAPTNTLNAAHAGGRSDERLWLAPGSVQRCGKVPQRCRSGRRGRRPGREHRPRHGDFQRHRWRLRHERRRRARQWLDDKVCASVGIVGQRR
jgi:hypothetical protein